MNDTFEDYVLNFYGSGGIYDMGATFKQVAEATLILRKKVGDNFEGDTIDREAVREILIDTYNLKFPEANHTFIIHAREEIEPENQFWLMETYVNYYLSWFNDLLTIEKFSEYYGFNVNQSKRIINKGRVLYNDKFGGT